MSVSATWALDWCTEEMVKLGEAFTKAKDERDRYRRALERIAALPDPWKQRETWREIAQDALAGDDD